MGVEEWPLGIERAKAERVAVGAGIAACAATVAEGLVGRERAPALCGGPACCISRFGRVASCAEAGIRIVFDGMLKLGDELTTCPEVNSGEISKPSLIFVNIVLRNIPI
jgi:hypothetical protein